MKQIFIVLTYTGTMLSKIIKYYTKDEFAHVSIAFDKELKEMYSFGRLNPNNPFIGGFVHETINKGVYKKFYKTKAKIYVLDITEKEHQNLKKIISTVECKDYKFNIIGLFAAGFHKKIIREQAFYCAEFVKYIMETANIENNLPSIVRPEDFKNLQGTKEIYTGLLREYKV